MVIWNESPIGITPINEQLWKQKAPGADFRGLVISYCYQWFIVLFIAYPALPTISLLFNVKLYITFLWIF
jgi:hypothetical protein